MASRPIGVGRQPPPPGVGSVRFERSFALAAAAIFWERLWPAAMPLLAVVGVFLALSWAGLWTFLPDYPRLGLVTLFVVATLAALRPLARLARPERTEVLSRLETVNGLVGRPLATLEDELANAADPGTVALWRAHRGRLAAALGDLSPGLPSPRADRRDPWSLRALLFLVLVVCGFAAGSDRWPLIAGAFRLPAGNEIVDLRIDAWLNPPAYTARPPRLLGESRDGDPPIPAPEGSVVVLRLPAATEAAVTLDDGGMPVAQEPEKLPQAGAEGPVLRQFRIPLATASRLLVTEGGRILRDWTFAVEEDADPTIEVLDQPSGTVSGALDLKYRLTDDYGVVSAEATFAPVVSSRSAKETRPLYGAPDFALRLPKARVRSDRAETIRNVTAHPWAGAPVDMTLLARDEAGQVGRSDSVRFTLPARRFGNPLARALVEQRRNLALDANAAGHVGDALEALLIAPERFLPDRNVYLGLVVARQRLGLAASDDHLRSVVDLLWQIALSLEDGNLSLEAEAVRTAADRLMEALEKGASDEEIARLTEELRQALAGLMQALAERQADRNAPVDENATIVDQKDLERLLDRLEDLARSGARDAARDLLAEMQQMMENLATGEMTGGDPASAEMNRALDELGNMIRRQNELMNDTFDLDRDARSGETRPDGKQQPGSSNDRQRRLDEAAEGQKALEEGARQLSDRLRQLGAGENEALDRAAREMGKAAGNLGRGKTGNALEDQGEALRSLREGAESLAEALAERRQGVAGRGGGRAGREDPLGRPDRSRGPQFGDSIKVPDEIDAARARQILEEIRRRLGEISRPQDERDYLERLLRRY